MAEAEEGGGVGFEILIERLSFTLRGLLKLRSQAFMSSGRLMRMRE
jgi:hypothetical protein